MTQEGNITRLFSMCLRGNQMTYLGDVKEDLSGRPVLGGNYRDRFRNELHPRQSSKMFPTLYKYVPVTASSLLHHTKMHISKYACKAFLNELVC